MQAALDVPLPRLFDYLVPEGIQVRVGDRVVVPFGTRQRLGVVVSCTAATEVATERLKPLTSVRNDAPPLSESWLRFIRFLADYYQRPVGETIIGALPPRLRSVKPLPRKVARDAAQRAEESAPGMLRFVPNHVLAPAQAGAVETIDAAAGLFSPFLLHGVTGSGKTEVYLHAIARVLERGEQALVLVPEISLTPQLEARFREAFPATRIALLHSGLEDVARTAAWLEAARGEAGVILGTRLALLAPIPRLEIIVVDEEHDTSFKQQEGLRYSARDAAVYLAKLRSCPVVLGTATPSLETWHNWRTGKYVRLALPERAASGSRLPAMRTVDLRRDPGEQGLSVALLKAVTERLERGEQSLLFLNRRGYAPVLACEPCGWAAGCTRCTVRLVVHSADRRLRCHHCGAEEPIPRACPTCGNVDLRPMGRGTQRIEESLAARFPGARIVRIDRDSARRRAELSRVLASVQRGEADILVGTQLLAKGHDFPALTLVGVLNSDTALLSTDYRAPERLFAVLAQVAGRAGRRERPGEVILQTRFPDHPLFGALARHDFEGFAQTQLEERRAAGFPPFVFEAAVRAEAKKLEDALAFLRKAARSPEPPEDVQVYDPVAHVVTRRAGFERAQLVIQSGSRTALQAHIGTLRARLFDAAPRHVRWHIDVDPIEFD